MVSKRTSRSVAAGTLVAKAQRRERRGDHEAARALFEAALRCRLPAPDSSPAALLRWIGNTHRAQGDIDAAVDCYTASLAVAEIDNAPGDIAHALNWLAIAAQERGEVDGARGLYIRAQAYAGRARDRPLLAMIGQNLGVLATIQGQHHMAVRHFRRSLQYYRRLRDRHVTASLLNNLGVLQAEMRSWDDAMVSFDEAAELSDATRDRATRAMVEVNRTDLWFRRGDLTRALRCCNRARNLAARIEHEIALGEAYKWYGIIYREMQSYEVAETHLDAAAHIAERYGNLLLSAEVQRERAMLYRAQRRNHAALQALNDAHRAFSHLHARRMLRDVNDIIHQLERIFLEIVSQWGDSLERKDRYTRGHCQRVADYTCMLARAAGFDERALIWLRMGAFLHDVGKTAIPEEILNKRGPLSPEEWRVMQRHTIIGVELISAIEFPWDIRPLVRSHHEHWDGTGYPDGLKGDEIPLTARILCVADVYDALTTTRSYRPAHGPDVALAMLEQDAGRIFDPELVARFVHLMSAPRRPASTSAA
ncbi:MAG: HD domain-containing phosphohydrolase [Gemmatimonadota bacterium]